MKDHATMKARARELRRGQTLAETVLWQRLRLHQVAGVRFLRQYAVGAFILDFYSPSVRLAIELDGGQHYEPNARVRDAARSQRLAARGIEVLRYSNLDVRQRIDDVVCDVWRAVVRRQQHPPAAARRPPSCGRG